MARNNVTTCQSNRLVVGEELPYGAWGGRHWQVWLFSGSFHGQSHILGLYESSNGDGERNYTVG